jgi:hypothetical protein
MSRQLRSSVFTCIAEDDVVARLSAHSVTNLKRSVLTALKHRLPPIAGNSTPKR